MPAAFAFAARVPPEGSEDTVTRYAYKAYFCERATNASPEEPSTAVTAESSAGKAVLPVIEDKDVLGSNHHPTPDQCTYGQTRPDSVRPEDPTTSLRGLTGSLGVDDTTNSAFTRANTPESPPQDTKLETADSNITAASPLGFHFIPAPCQSTPVLSFLGARTPFTIFSGQKLMPTASRVRPAEPEPRVRSESTSPTAFVLCFQPAPANLSSPPPSTVVDPDPDEFSETTKRVPNREEPAPQKTQEQAVRPDTRVQEARDRAVRAARVFAQNGAALAQELDDKAPVPDYDTASEKTPNSTARLQFRLRTTGLRRGGEPLSPGQRINAPLTPRAHRSLRSLSLSNLA